MNKPVKKIRRKIKQRKKKRGIQLDDYESKQIYPSFIEEEEKHGFYQSIPQYPLKQNEANKRIREIVAKSFLSIVLFLSMSILLQTNASFIERPKQYVTYLLTEEFPFARVNKWYQTTFGEPLSFIAKDKPETIGQEDFSLPFNGDVIETFQMNGTGIMMGTEEETTVKAFREGIVIFSGNDRETKKTVVIQHADNSKSIYGYLSSLNVHLYQSVSTNQAVGTFQPQNDEKNFYFSIVNNNEYIDPIQVIQVDDSP